MVKVQPLTNVYEIKKILISLKEKSPRDYYITTIALTTGLRISDILNLKIEQFRDSPEITIIERKTNKRKCVMLSNKLRNMILNYCKNRRSYEYLFKSSKVSKDKIHKNIPMTRQGYYKSINKIVKLKDKNLNAHTLRKTYAYWALNETNNLPLITKCLNHSSQRVTLDYLGINQEEINNVTKKLEKRFLK